MLAFVIFIVQLCDFNRSRHFSNVVNEGGVGSGGVGGSTDVKPRSLRFTWSMKTTSSRDPNEIMAEIKKVRRSASMF